MTERCIRLMAGCVGDACGAPDPGQMPADVLIPMSTHESPPSAQVTNTVKFKGPLRVQGTVRIELASKPCEDPSKGRRVDVRLDRWEFNVAGLPRLVIPVGSFGPEGV